MNRRIRGSWFAAGLGLTLATVVCACGGESFDAQSATAAGNGEHPLVGQPGPDFSGKPLVGGKRTISLHGLSGKVAIVDFWATWCEPCKKSFPKLQALDDKYGADGLQVVGISEDDDQTSIGAFAADLGTKFPLLWDENKAIASKWQPKSMPSTYVLDRNGVVRFVHLGFHDREEAAIEREVKSLL